MSFLKSNLPLKICIRYVRDITKRMQRQEFYNRRIEIGPEKERHRSEFSNWNYESEIFAFGKRLKENFDMKYLSQAFIDKSYINSSETPNIQNNTELRNYGHSLASRYTRSFLIHNFPDLPSEWIDQLWNHLLSVHLTAHVSGHLGTKDLIFHNYDTLDLETESGVLFAIIGALAKSQNENVAFVFIKDFILTQLSVFHLCDVIQIDNAFNLLSGVLLYHQKGAPMPRLLRQSGMNSVFACYHVGIYSDNDLIGEAAGESLLAAEDMAARHSLLNLFGVSENRSTIDFEDKLEIDFNKKPSYSIADYLKCIENK